MLPADRRAWEEIRRREIAAILIGEPHHDPEMMAAEKSFLSSAFSHGARVLVIEYPRSHQSELDRFLRNPTYKNLAWAIAGERTPEQLGKSPRERAAAIEEIAARHEAVGEKNRKKIEALALTSAEIAAATATVEKYRLWEAADRIGYRVIGGDLGPERGIDGHGHRVSHPTIEETFRYRWSPYGMRERNEALADTIATAFHSHGLTIAIVGAAHAGFLPEERLDPQAPSPNTYPGLNFLLADRFGLSSLAIVRSRVSRQGYLAQIGLRILSPDHSRESLDGQTKILLQQDPFRVLADDPSRPLESALPQALEKQKESAAPVVLQPPTPQPQPGVFFNRR
ncbi:hypothetical protein [Methylacidimicrobium cyclopophantes]|uniref:hypothetical protein n=1 Tax=Methylacidimicrobium cyclopophantes TaxID=1041766 RepID=UPI0015B5389A|nr:hypothetical protein [Methylacidimicrobium cyclopophantes]